LNKETGSPARSTRIVEKLTVKLDAQQLIKTTNYQELGKAIEFAFWSALHRQIFLTGLHTAVIVPHLF
jgi:hypothetical protein